VLSRGRRTARHTIFLHIPKTAGTSLGQILREFYPGDRCLFIYEHDFTHDALQRRALRREVQRAEVVYGHLWYGVHRTLGVRARYVTIVREPAARVVSFFRHQARDPESEYFERIAAGMTLLDLLRGERCHQVSNHMTRILNAKVDGDLVSDRKYLERALENLATHFVVVGVSEQMGRSVELVGRALRWDSLPDVPVLNVDPEPNGALLDDETRGEILRYNALDVELYDRVAQDFAATTFC
jgi:hypothetical protein